MRPWVESLCPMGDCNYQSQSGCTGAQGCLPARAAGAVEPKCQDVGTTKRGAACTDYAECEPGTFCAEGQCRKLCCGNDWGTCGTGESCIRQVEINMPGGAPVAANVGLCFPTGDCELLGTNNCGAGRHCQLVDPTGAVACAPSGTAGLGGSCSPTSPCREGFTCVNKSCRRLCRAVEGGGEPSCPDAEGACVHFDRNPVGIGECTPLKNPE